MAEKLSTEMESYINKDEDPNPGKSIIKSWIERVKVLEMQIDSVREWAERGERIIEKHSGCKCKTDKPHTTCPGNFEYLDM